MAEFDAMSPLHKSTTRDYLARVNDKDYPKEKAATIAKQFGKDYWDGDRRICYGGYHYIDGRWQEVAKNLISRYNLMNGSKVLDVGCGKGFLLYDLEKENNNIKVQGLDISDYAIENCKDEMKGKIVQGSATHLPWEDGEFDLVISINTLHNLKNYELEKSLKEIERVGKQKYICVESYRNEKEKSNLLYWQVTCEAFNTPDEWKWWFEKTGYSGDFSFIYFE